MSKNEIDIESSTVFGGEPLKWIVQVNVTGEYFLIIRRPVSGELLVQIPFDGDPEYGETYEPDEAARVFWSALANAFPEYLRDPEAEGAFVPAPLLGPGSGALDTTLIRKPTSGDVE